MTVAGDAATLQALLSDGAAWSTSALGLALGESQRTVQHALVELEAAGRARACACARSALAGAAAGGIHDNLVTPFMQSLPCTCDAGTAFDGRYLYQIAETRIDKIDPASGEVLARLEMPSGTDVSGPESDGAELFYAGGGDSGKVRAVRRPKSASA